jgi:hypothetical protein
MATTTISQASDLFLEAIKVQHEENVDTLKKMAGGLP